ncbi:unnamed protein product [Linum trigynum]|uniref:Uncharacterized protein n=1 Tax=Linum trigynum TaxID=586398 RepID=A0AAV2DZE0_9ROSI
MPSYSLLFDEEVLIAKIDWARGQLAVAAVLRPIFGQAEDATEKGEGDRLRVRLWGGVGWSWNASGLACHL